MEKLQQKSILKGQLTIFFTFTGASAQHLTYTNKHTLTHTHTPIRTLAQLHKQALHTTIRTPKL